MIEGSITLERMDENNREISQGFEGLEGAERFRVLNAAIAVWLGISCGCSIAVSSFPASQR